MGPEIMTRAALVWAKPPSPGGSGDRRSPLRTAQRVATAVLEQVTSAPLLHRRHDPR
jgi:hypothetical protein